MNLRVLNTPCLIAIVTLGCGSTGADAVVATTGGSGGLDSGGGSGGSGGSGAGSASGGSSSGGSTGSGGTSSGGTSSGGTSSAGGSSGAGGSGGANGAACGWVHPDVNGSERTCGDGYCFCATPDGCFPSQTASSCCDVAVVCGPGAEEPVATIFHPGNNEPGRVANTDIPFSGEAVDPQDGALSGAAMVWTSDQLIDPIGTGQSFTTQLPAGLHVITLTATDSDSNTGLDSITLNIE